MIRELIPVTQPVRAHVRVPGSKSITNRALICAALAGGASHLRKASDSDDTLLLINGLNQLGVLARKQDSDLIVEGTGGKLFAPKFPIPVQNAGTTLRFLIGLASLAKGQVQFVADPRMAERPVGDLLTALHALGTPARVDRGERYVVEGGLLKGGSTRLRTDRSSQFLSSLLMVGAYAKEGVRIESEGDLVSEPYVEMTVQVMSQFAVEVGRPDKRTFVVGAGQRYVPAEFVVEPDASGASYFMAAAAILGGVVVIEGLGRATLQGDLGFVRILERMGCAIKRRGDDLEITRSGSLVGIDVDMNTMPDLVPTLAVAALFAETPSHIRNIRHLRFKESDRLEALATELPKIGAMIRPVDDGMIIGPARLHGAQLDTFSDHRLAMSFALIGLRIPGISLNDPDCVRKSFPRFWLELENLYSRK